MLASHRRLALWTVALGALAFAPGPAHAARPSAGPEPAPPASEGPTVAVLYFDYSGEDDSLAVLRKGLTQMLVSDLTALGGLRVVERERLEEVLAELELSKSRKIDPATAARLGKLLGARYLVMGSYFELLGTLRADARVVEVETGRIVGSFGGHGKPGEFLEVEQKLGRSLGEALTATLALPPEPHEPQPKTAARRRPKPPKRLATKTAVRYSKALDAKDKGDLKEARKELEATLAEQPDFQLATAELDRLIQ